VPKISRFQKKSRKWLIFALPFGRKVVTLRHHVRPEVAKAIILPSVEVSKSAVPSAVA
jgi:hypothetical protein